MKKEEKKTLAERREYLINQKTKLLARVTHKSSAGLKQLLRTFDIYNEEIDRINKTLKERQIF